MPKVSIRPRADPQNIRVIAKYYSRVTMTRLTELLDLPPHTTERTLCKLVTDKTVYARIDRPAGIVTFKQKKTHYQTLNEWSGDVSKILSLVEKTSHLVSKVSRSEWTSDEVTHWQEYAMQEAVTGKKITTTAPAAAVSSTA